QLGSGWAPRGLSAALGALRGPAGGLDPPSRGRRSGRVVAVHSVLPSGGAAGVAVGAHVLELNGQPFLPLAHRSRGALRPGVVNHYVFERPDGERFARDLAPVPCAENRSEVDVLVHVLLLLVALIYLGTGTIVYWLRPDRSGAWALLLFCSALSVQLAITLASDQISGAYFHLVLNAPLIGATTFHLFTTYPSEPGWVVRRRRVQVLPYLGAALVAALCFLERRLGLPPGLASEIGFLYMAALVIGSLAILAGEWRRHRDGPLREVTDLVTLAAVVSFVPVLGVFLVEWMTQKPYPFYLALLWTFVFPVAVGYGIVYRQLFDLRNVARSSAAYGAASIGITGAFAFLITFADTLVSDFGVSTRSAQVALLFVAILLFNPVRNRMQSL